MRAVRPALSRVVRSVFSSGSSRAERPAPRTRPVEIEEIEPRLLQYLAGDAVMAIPGTALRYSGGLAYSYEQHHFLQYYIEGRGALVRFYGRHQPQDIFERHFLSGSRDANGPRDGYPWVWQLSPAKSASRGEGDLGPEHGRQHHGPVTAEKIDFETRRLDSVCRSIRDNGYEPRLAGFPRGYFLLDDDGSWIFHVKGGQHRVAAMVHLKYPRIQASFHPNHPRVVRAVDVANWPMVWQGVLTRDEALMIFRAYFRAPATRVL